MRGIRVEEIACDETVTISRRIESAAVTSHPIVDSRPLRMIENVECFAAELEPFGRAQNKTLKERNVEICPPWIT